MPRTSGVSTNSRVLRILRRPRPRTVARCDSWQPIGLRTNCTVIVCCVVILRLPVRRRVLQQSCRAWLPLATESLHVKEHPEWHEPCRATLDALSHATTPSQVAAKRGKTVEELFV